MTAGMHSNTIAPFLRQVRNLRKVVSQPVLPSIFELDENFLSIEAKRYTSTKSDELSTSDLNSNELKETRDLNSVEQPKEKESMIHQAEALVNKLHPDDRPMSKVVPVRSKTEGIDDILARWNVNKPKK